MCMIDAIIIIIVVVLIKCFVTITQINLPFSGISGSTSRPWGAPGTRISPVVEWLATGSWWVSSFRDGLRPGGRLGCLAGGMQTVRQGWKRASGTVEAGVCELGLKRSFLRAHLLHTPQFWGK